MIDSVIASFDVSFDEPACPVPGLLDGTQRCVTASLGAEPMRMVTELLLVVGFQDLPDNLLKELIRPGWEPQRSELIALLLGDVDATNWRPAIAFMPQIVNDLVDFRHRHGVHSFRRDSRSHCTFVGIQLGVRPQVQQWVVELSVDILQRELSLAALLDDIQHGCGCSHLEYLTFLNIVVTCAASPCTWLSHVPWRGVTSAITISTPSP